MPYVTLSIAKERLTPELKAKFIARISEAVADVIVEDCGADKEKVLPQIWCVIEEIPFENWGIGGVTYTLEILKESIGIS